jgi:hypothetical protein
MGKRQLKPAEAFDLRQTLHVAVLVALMASRRWAPGELIFQGGTSLHLVHGSPRFSEDLDFLVEDSLKLNSIGSSIQSRLAGTPWLPDDMGLIVTPAKDGRNPHVFDIAVSGEGVLGSVRVKVELWKTPAEALKPLATEVRTVRLIVGRAAGAQAFVPTLDKVFAVAARPYLKPRDVFDLYWLAERGEAQVCTDEDLAVRLATYPNETPANWLAKAAARRQELLDSAGKVKADLQRWLPPSWPLTDEKVQAMIEASVAAIDRGAHGMRVLAGQRDAAIDVDVDAEPDPEAEAPAP